MSIQGLEKVIQTQGPVARPYGLLLDVANQLSVAQMSDNGVNRVGAGVTYVPWGCEPLRRGNVSCDSDWLLQQIEDEESGEVSEDEVDGKPALSYPEVEVQRPFKIVDSLMCNALSMLPEEMDDRVRVRMRELMSAMFAEELVAGTASGGLSLANRAFVVSPEFSTFPDLVGVASALERFLADSLHGATGVIHMPVELVAAAKYANWVYHDGSSLKTCTGHDVVADAGYTGKVVPDGENPAGAGEFYIYATGPIWYHLTDTMLLGDNPNETFDIEFNVRRRIAEAVGLVAFDPCSVGAVKVSFQNNAG
jgi:hypothetical protein